jgi:TldD protein
MRRRDALAALLAPAAAAWAAPEDPLLEAMREEVARAASLKVQDLESPYFVEAAVDQVNSYAVSAADGALVREGRNQVRLPQVRIRVGGYDFDNTNFVGSDLGFAGGYNVNRLPLDASPEVVRRYLWLAADSTYKSALEAIARKRAALRGVAAGEQIDDFAKAEPLRLIGEIRPFQVDEESLAALARRLSGALSRFPTLLESGVEAEAIDNIHYLVTSEGTAVRIQERLAFVRARASIQAGDGMILDDGVVFHAAEASGLASEAEMRRGIEAMGERLTAMAAAGQAESYSGPVLFEGAASAQLFAQVLGRGLSLFRRPVTMPGRPAQFPSGELEGRLGARVLPEWMDVVDDPTQKEWRGRRLFGHYQVDLEGVAPTPLLAVEKGVLRGYLMSRQPMRGVSGSNGRGRLPGPFGARSAAIGNLFVRASETVTEIALRQQFLNLLDQRGKPYGLVVRKFDFPSAAGLAGARRMLASLGRQSGAMPVALPVAVYRVYPDGREEPARGLRFRSLNARSLRDIVAASDQVHPFEFLNNTAPLALMGAGGYVAESAVFAPSVLVDDVELEPVDQEHPKPPIVPPPT